MTTAELAPAPADCTYSADCATRAAADRLSNKWVGLVIFCLTGRPHHFGELHRRIEGISRKVLAQTLRALERDGLVLRTPQPAGNPPPVCYSLTPLGESFVGPLTGFYGWMQQHAPAMRALQAQYDAVYAR